MLVSERDHGRVDTTYPFLDRFSKVVAFFVGSNRQYILDVTEKYVPPNLVPYQLLNTYAFIVHRKKPNLVRIRTIGAYRNVIDVTATMAPAGSLQGNATIASYSYAKQIRTEQLKSDQKKFVKDLSSDNNLYVDNALFENVDDDNNPLIQSLQFHNDASANAGYVLLNCNFFTNLLKNPFVAKERFTNVNFGYRQDFSVRAAIRLPAGFNIEKLPENKSWRLGEGDLLLSRNASLDGDTLHVFISFSQSLTLVHYADYPSLREMYKQAIEFLNEPVVVKVR
jgi:hypothetical protein